MFRSIRSYLTLKYVRHAFNDAVSGGSVDVYVDCYGDHWMKSGRWSFFKVRTYP